MCKCYICDASIESIQFNSDHGDIDPCSKCLQIISEVFGDEEDDPHEVVLGDATPEEMEMILEDLPRWMMMKD